MAYRNPNAPVIGRLIATGTDGRRIEIDSNPANRIRFYAADGTWQYGYLEVTDGSDFASLKMQTPVNPGAPAAQIPFLSLDYDNVGTDTAVLYGGDTVQFAGNGWNLEVSSPGEIARPLVTWTNLTLAGTWATVGGRTPQYYVDPVKTVHLRGSVNGGAANPIGTLPVGARPSQAMRYPLKANADAGTISWVEITTAGAINAIGNFAAAVVMLDLPLSFNALP